MGAADDQLITPLDLRAVSNYPSQLLSSGSLNSLPGLFGSDQRRLTRRDATLSQLGMGGRCWAALAGCLGLGGGVSQQAETGGHGTIQAPSAELPQATHTSVPTAPSSSTSEEHQLAAVEAQQATEAENLSGRRAEPLPTSAPCALGAIVEGLVLIGSLGHGTLGRSFKAAWSGSPVVVKVIEHTVRNGEGWPQLAQAPLLASAAASGSNLVPYHKIAISRVPSPPSSSCLPPGCHTDDYLSKSSAAELMEENKGGDDCLSWLDLQWAQQAQHAKVSQSPQHYLDEQRASDTPPSAAGEALPSLGSPVCSAASQPGSAAGGGAAAVADPGLPALKAGHEGRQGNESPRLEPATPSPTDGTASPLVPSSPVRPPQGLVLPGRVPAQDLLSLQEMQGVPMRGQQARPARTAFQRLTAAATTGGCEGQQQAADEAAQQTQVQPGSYEIYVLQDFCDRGGLGECLRKRKLVRRKDGSHNTRAIYGILNDVARGMEHLHSLSVVHGDLRTGNVMLQSSASDLRGYVARVGDYGLATLLGAELAHSHSRSVGAVGYLAPEVITQGELGRAADVFAYGMLMYEIWTCERVYPHMTAGQIFKAVLKGTLRPPVPPDAPGRYISLMQSCWEEEEHNRPPFSMILWELREQVKEIRRHERLESMQLKGAPSLERLRGLGDVVSAALDM